VVISSRAVRRATVALGAAALAACGSFEDPEIVLDLRMLAVVVEPPEQVFPIDPDNPTNVELAPFTACALVADPGLERGLSWSLSVCPQATNLRCDPDRPQFVAAEGRLDDPDTSVPGAQLCATVPGDLRLLDVVRDTLENDNLQGFGGVDINLALTITPDGGTAKDAIFGGKAARFSAKLPAERVANANPTLDRIDVDLDGGEPVPLPLGRCVDQAAPLTIAPGQRLHLMPIEPAGAREVYVLPTFEGGSRTFTENLRYQWLAGAGDWTRGGTGGPRDGAGNPAELDTVWRTPSAEDVGAGQDVPLWIIQRDERGGTAWFEACVRVRP
jgi:hypothetical protein